jgi:transposase
MRTTMGRRAYASDLTDQQWEVLGPMIPLPSLDGRPPTVERREIVNAILYVLRSGCPWRLLPHEFPAWGTVYSYFRRWEREGVWKQVLLSLRMEMRQKEGRNAEPSAAVIDSQSIKTSAVRGSDKGYDAGKKNLGTQTAPVS